MGGVDRNWNLDHIQVFAPEVATHMGGVDRNRNGLSLLVLAELSPPTWVAWIETSITRT